MAGPVLLRKAVEGEQGVLAAIGHASFASALGRASGYEGRGEAVARGFADFVARDLQRLIVIEASGEIVGFGAREGLKDEISDVWIKPERRGVGLGAILLSALEGEVQLAGYPTAFLDVHVENESAIGFYRRQGYHVAQRLDARASTLLPGMAYSCLRMVKRFSRPRAMDLETLADVREAIDNFDPELVSLLAERFTYIDRAAAVKAPEGLPANIPDRVEAVVEKARAAAHAIGFDPSVTESVFRAMIDVAIAREEAHFKTLNRRD